jgi:diaminohydroxyphosphoribosylaminopyrimidine deaminase / 5-amino-6-(5-phosphoribosylamino)uracil reductase
MSDYQFMARAIQLAKKGLYTTDPNPRVGCVIVKNEQIVGEGWHERAGEPHAEINAIKMAGENAAGATAFVTLEPCSHQGRTPPCADALIKADVARVVAAMQDPNPQVSGSGLKRIADAGIATESGLLEEQAKALNPGFIKRMSKGLPYVRAKLAMSLDGRTAMASGESMWITGDAARHDVQKLRARSSAILTGSGTMLADDPSLNVRLNADELNITGEVRQPLRVVVDNHLSSVQDAKMFGLHGKSLIFTAASARSHWQKDSVEIVQLAEQPHRVDLHEVMKNLAKREINEVHVEAGSVLCGALLEAGLIDEIIIYMAPHIMGDDAKGLFHLPGLTEMKQRIDLEIKDIRPIGKDWRITVSPRIKN